MEQIREKTESPLSPVEPGEYEKSIASIREQLDGAAFEKAWAEGSAMTLEQVIEFALQETK